MKKNKPSDAETGRRLPKTDASRTQNKQVFSYYSNRSQEAEPRARKDTFDESVKSTNRKSKYIPTIIAGLVVIFSLIYASLINTSNPNIVPLTENR